MPANLIEEFQNSTDDTLLKQLLKTFAQTVDLPEDKQVERLVQCLKKSLEDQGDANS